MSARMDKRNAAIVEMYVGSKLTLAEVASEFLITRERVRQILNNAGVVERHGNIAYQEDYQADLTAAHQRICSGESTVEQEAKDFGIKRRSFTEALRRHGLKLPSPASAEHGTRYYYSHYGCRCDLCRTANREYSRSLKGKEPPTHGASGYTNYGCRCIECRAGVRAAKSQRLMEREI